MVHKGSKQNGENEIGSIRAGKRADFVVLAEDPMTAPADALRTIKVEATIFSGVAYPTP